MRELKEAEFWLETAKKLLCSESRDNEKYTVVVAQSIHSIIRANDALTSQLLNKRTLRHDDAPQLFLELIRLNKIPAKFAGLRTTVIAPAVQLKSKVDYKGLWSSKAEAERWIKNAEVFLYCVKQCLE